MVSNRISNFLCCLTFMLLVTCKKNLYLCEYLNNHIYIQNTSIQKVLADSGNKNMTSKRILRLTESHFQWVIIFSTSTNLPLFLVRVAVSYKTTGKRMKLFVVNHGG